MVRHINITSIEYDPDYPFKHSHFTCRLSLPTEITVGLPDTSETET